MNFLGKQISIIGCPPLAGSPVAAILVTSLLFAFSPVANAQANFESKTNGVWNSNTTWTIVSGTDADTIPDANDNVTIKAGHTVTAGNANRDCASLVVNTGGALRVDSTGNIRINANPGSAAISGTITMSSLGSLQETGSGTSTLILDNGGRMTISGSPAFPAFDFYLFDPNSTVEYMAAANQNVQSGIAYGNLTVGGSGKKTVAPLPSDTAFTANGKVTINSGVAFDVSTNILYANFNGDVQIDGTLDISVGIVVVEMHGASWINNGTYLCSVLPGFGHQPTTTFYNTQITGTTLAQKFYDVIFVGNTSTLVSLDSVRNLEIRPGATLNGGSATTHKLSGNWINNGTYSCNSSTVTLIGTATQSVAGSTFGNLVVNNPAGITFTGNVTIAPTCSLTLANGNVTTGNFILSIDNPSPSALVLGSNRILGKVTRAMGSGSTGTYTFFSGDAFVVPNGINNPSSITMTEFPSTFPPALGPGADTAKIVKRYYRVTQVGAGSGFAFTMRLPYLQSEVRGNEASYALFRNGGTGWLNMGSTIANVTDNYVEQSALTDFSDWAIAEGDQTLPIQLAHFGASIVANTRDVRLTWGTITETNNYGFYAQRREEAQADYADLPNSFVPGHGTTLEPHEYTWTDVNVQTGTYYYRLKQVDLDATAHFTDGVRIEVSTLTTTQSSVPSVFDLAQNYPNPFNPSTSIEFTVERKDFTTLTVHNILGQTIATLFSGIAVPGQRYTTRFDGDKLTNGIYFFRLTSGTESALRKMILLK